MSVAIYYVPASDWGDLRTVNLGDYIKSVTGLQSKMDLTIKTELAHPTIELDMDVLDVVTIVAGSFINYELNGIIFLRSRITKVSTNTAGFTLKVQTVDMIENLRNHTIQEVWDFVIPYFPYNFHEFRNNSGEDYREHYVQLVWLLRVFLASIGINYLHTSIGWDCYNGDDSYSEYDNIKYCDLVFQADLFQRMGKTNEDDEKSANAYDVFALILRVLSLKYTYHDDDVIITKLDTPAITATVGDYKFDELTNLGFELNASFLDITETQTPAFFGFHTAPNTIANWWLLHPDDSWGTLSVNIKDENAEKMYSISFPPNFVIMDKAVYGVSHIPFSNTEWPWELSNSIWQLIFDKFKAMITPADGNKLMKYKIDQALLFNKDFHSLNIDVANNISKIEYYTEEEE